MEKQPSSTEALEKVLVRLARNNINILEVKYTEGADGPTPNAVLFEYQWRVSANTTKWTRAVLPWLDYPTSSTIDEYGLNYNFILLTVRNLRAGLEA